MSRKETVITPTHSDDDENNGSENSEEDPLLNPAKNWDYSSESTSEEEDTSEAGSSEMQDSDEEETESGEEEEGSEEEEESGEEEEETEKVIPVKNIVIEKEVPKLGKRIIIRSTPVAEKKSEPLPEENPVETPIERQPVIEKPVEIPVERQPVIEKSVEIPIERQPVAVTAAVRRPNLKGKPAVRILKKIEEPIVQEPEMRKEPLSSGSPLILALSVFAKESQIDLSSKPDLKTVSVSEPVVKNIILDQEPGELEHELIFRKNVTDKIFSNIQNEEKAILLGKKASEIYFKQVSYGSTDDEILKYIQ